MTRIWITRTLPSAEKSAEAWTLAGFEPVVAPLLAVKPVKPEIAIPDGAELIITSAQAIRHCGASGDDRRVYTVGSATAQIARDHGFTNVVSADGDWEDLLSVIMPTDNPLVHVSGQVVRGHLVQRLKARGFQVSRVIVYETQAVTDWPINPSDVQAVALYSPLASQTLMQLPARDIDHLTAYCLSAAVSDELSGPDIRVASHPNESALIACSDAKDA